MEFDELSGRVIGCALEVHRHLGPGLLEPTYKQCLAYELAGAEIPFKIEQPLAVKYKSIRIDCGFRVDLLVDNAIIVEAKAVERLLPIHEAQLLTYMRLADVSVGLLINFNVRILNQGIKRMVI